MTCKILLSFIGLFFCGASFGQSTADVLIEKSIAFHDPHNNWKKFKSYLSFTTQRPDRPDGKKKVFIDNKKKMFSFWAQYDEGVLTYKVEKNKPIALWNNKPDIPEDQAKKYRISEDRATMYRDYYTYLYGMPMKLKDKGTIVDPEVTQVEFYGKQYDKVKVTYLPEVGDDIWYFYFDPQTHALEAYQFFHDESKNDGEYILFEELREVDQIKLPRIRKWYYNKDEKFLATDILQF